MENASRHRLHWLRKRTVATFIPWIGCALFGGYENMRLFMLVALAMGLAMAKEGYAPITRMQFDLQASWLVQSVIVELNAQRKVTAIRIERNGKLLNVGESYIKRLERSPVLNGCYLSFEEINGLYLYINLVQGSSGGSDQIVRVAIDVDANVHERLSQFPE